MTIRQPAIRPLLVSTRLLPALVLAASAVCPAAGTGTSASLAPAAPATELQVVEAADVAPAWAGHPVGFSLLTHGDTQFVGFYDADRQMTIGRRKLPAGEWELVRLPEKIGWDSHNYITMALDSEKHLHVSGNMHGHPLVYFRASRPLDVASLDRKTSMTGEAEKRCTYPRFFTGPEGQLIFGYRDGSSGDGDQIYNEYNTKTRQWTRLLDKPLSSGEGQMNAYLHGPVRGPDGYFHLCWVWRDTPDCATNHDLCYARSRDLRQWETASGKPLALPITLSTADVVDPVPPGGGIINGNTVLGFDSQQRPIITYHKYDGDGNTQVYNARLEQGDWKLYQVTEWDYRWDFSGGGSINFEVQVSGVRTAGPGRLTQRAGNPKTGSAGWILDEATMKIIGPAPRQPKTGPARWNTVQSQFPGMEVRWGNDSGKAPHPGTRYRLHWETLNRNRDKPRPEPHPEPTMLRVLKIEEKPTTATKSAKANRS